MDATGAIKTTSKELNNNEMDLGRFILHYLHRLYDRQAISDEIIVVNHIRLPKLDCLSTYRYKKGSTIMYFRLNRPLIDPPSVVTLC